MGWGADGGLTPRSSSTRLASVKIAIFGPTDWCIGEIWRNVAPCVGADIIDWSVSHPRDLFAGYDRVITQAGEAAKTLRSYDVPREKILVTGNAASDVIGFLRIEGNEHIREYAGYAVVSDTLAAQSLAIGITRMPSILRHGIDCRRYASPIPDRLRTVGYAAVWSRTNDHGVEIKRGRLAKEIAGKARLGFRSAANPAEGGAEYYQARITPGEKMPDFYRSVDAVIMPSLEEGGGMPMMEGAAAGRLTIGTPVGEFPRLACEGMGILAPLGERDFVDFAVGVLGRYAYDDASFREKCRSIQASAWGRDWSNVIQDWIDFARGRG